MKIVFTKKEVLATLAKWIIEQSPYLPDNLLQIIKDADNYIEKYSSPAIKVDRWQMYEDSQDSLRRRINILCHRVPSIANLNLSKAEVDRGYSLNDSRRGKWLFTSRYDSTPLENDFVDIGALSRNIWFEIKRNFETTMSIK